MDHKSQFERILATLRAIFLCVRPQHPHAAYVSEESLKALTMDKLQLIDKHERGYFQTIRQH